jgi:hypothetical protein
MATEKFSGDRSNVVYTGGVGVNDNDVVIQTGDVSAFDTFMLMSTAGVFDVFVSLDGTNYATAALSLADLGATSTSPVVVSVAGRVYGFRGTYKAIRVLQNGAKAVANAALIASKASK